MEKLSESEGREKILKNSGHTRYNIIFMNK